MQIGIRNDATNQLAPQAELMPRAFEKCTALRHLDLEKSEYNPARLTRVLPECWHLCAGPAHIRRHLPGATILRLPIKDPPWYALGKGPVTWTSD